MKYFDIFKSGVVLVTSLFLCQVNFNSTLLNHGTLVATCLAQGSCR